MKERIIIEISTSPDIMSGDWCIDGTRVPLRILMTMKSRKEMIKNYPHLKNLIKELE